MIYRTDKEDIALAFLGRLAIPLQFNVTPRVAFELALETPEMEYAEKYSFISEGTVKKALESLEQGKKVAEVSADLGIFSEYDLNILHLGESYGSFETACNSLIKFYALHAK